MVSAVAVERDSCRVRLGKGERLCLWSLARSPFCHSCSNRLMAMSLYLSFRYAFNLFHPLISRGSGASRNLFFISVDVLCTGGGCCK